METLKEGHSKAQTVKDYIVESYLRKDEPDYVGAMKANGDFIVSLINHEHEINHHDTWLNSFANNFSMLSGFVHKIESEDKEKGEKLNKIVNEVMEIVKKIWAEIRIQKQKNKEGVIDPSVPQRLDATEEEKKQLVSLIKDFLRVLIEKE